MGIRCQTEGCDKSAQGATGHCKAHGGGKRCQTEGCDKSAEGATGHCIAHGGGKRCQTEGCDKSAQGATSHCVAHGGGRRCQTEGCDNSAEGTTGHCVAHGGGKRCEMACCTVVTEDSVPTLAKHQHPVSRKWMCTYAARLMVEDAPAADRARLNKYFGFKKTLLVRGENVFMWEVDKHTRVLRDLIEVRDMSVRFLVGKSKSVTDKRPDRFNLPLSKDEKTGRYRIRMGLHGEYDETYEHENSLDRLDEIRDALRLEATYVYRIIGYHLNKELSLAKMRTIRAQDDTETHAYYDRTKRTESVAKLVARVVEERVGWIREGLLPSCDRPRIVYISAKGVTVEPPSDYYKKPITDTGTPTATRK